MSLVKSPFSLVQPPCSPEHFWHRGRKNAHASHASAPRLRRRLPRCRNIARCPKGEANTPPCKTDLGDDSTETRLRWDQKMRVSPEELNSASWDFMLILWGFYGDLLIILILWHRMLIETAWYSHHEKHH